MTLKMLVLVAGLVVPSTVLAQSDDPGGIRSEATDAVHRIGWRYVAAKAGQVNAADESPEACTLAVAKLRKTSFTTIAHHEFEELGGTPVKDSPRFELTLARAEQVCTEYAKFYKFGRHIVLFHDVLLSVSLMKPSMAPSQDFVDNTLAKVKECQAAMEELLAMGIPASFEFEVEQKKFTVGKIRAEICDIVPGAATRYTGDMADAKRKKEEPFVKAGLKGDRLELLVTYGGAVRLPGGGFSKDWKKYVAPAALFVVLNENTPDHTGHIVYTVNKYAFKGAKMVKSSTKIYRLLPAASLTAKHFR